MAINNGIYNFLASRSASVVKYSELNNLIKTSVNTFISVRPDTVANEEKHEISYTAFTKLFIALYTLLAFGNAIIDEIYNIWAAETPNVGGLGFSSGNIGLSLTVN